MKCNRNTTILTAVAYKFITPDTLQYQAGVALRISLFFEGMPDAQELINDDFENKSLHLVAIKEDQIIGTGRLYFATNTAIISQMTVAPDFQHQKIGQNILQMLLKECKTHQIEKITLSARVTALDFYAKFGFKAIGDTYPSVKTGVLHQNMELIPNKS